MVSSTTLANNVSTTAPLTQHPSMVEGAENRQCTYVEGVCTLHGPATKKWRGGRRWGEKKNGLFGWVYARKTYWVCEHKRGGPVGGPKPSFIYMDTSKEAENLSYQNTTGGKGNDVMKRFRDFEQSSKPAGRDRK